MQPVPLPLNLIHLACITALFVYQRVFYENAARGPASEVWTHEARITVLFVYQRVFYENTARASASEVGPRSPYNSTVFSSLCFL